MLIDGKDRLVYFADLFAGYLRAQIDDCISPSETMHNQWYMPVGVSAARAIYSACVTSWIGKVSSVLDLPCGHGRVLRHLVKLFPDARFDAADLDRDGVDFCAKRFGARPVYSEEDLTHVDFGKKYDVIWVGSLFTHLPRGRTKAWLEHLTKFLADGGIMVATFHGRYSALKGAEFGYITPACWKRIREGYETTGYGYTDYPAEHGYVQLECGYGVSLSKPATIIDEAMSIPEVRVFGYAERGWAGHQDVMVLGKPAVGVG